MKYPFTNGKNKQFSTKIQDIQMAYPNICNSFTIQNTTFLACGKGNTADRVTILKWSGEQFESFQDLPSTIVHGRPHIIQINGTVYLAIANFIQPGNNGNFDIDSFIYRWNGIKFVFHQSIPTHGAMGWDSITIEGRVFLVVANKYTKTGAHYNVKSAVYKMANNKFYLYQELPTTGAAYAHAFVHKGKQYLVVVNMEDKLNYNLDSQVYIWN